MSTSNFWPRQGFKGGIILKCSECGCKADCMIHFPLDTGRFCAYNDRGWLLCENCVETVSDAKREAVYNYVRDIKDRKNSKVGYYYHCLPFPCNKPFRVGRSDGSITEGCTLFANNAYYQRGEDTWIIVAGLEGDLFKEILVREWEKMNPDLVSDATRYFTCGSMFRSKDALLLEN